MLMLIEANDVLFMSHEPVIALISLNQFYAYLHLADSDSYCFTNPGIKISSQLTSVTLFFSISF